jgi:prophage antirepressor-like protein
MIFFFDIFNKLLKFNEDEIIIIFDKDGNVWFKYRDVLKALGYSDILHTIVDMKINIENKKNYKTISAMGLTPYQNNYIKNTNIKHNVIFINESGLYEVLTLSTKPLAKIFRDKYFKEIMPEIRKSGQYVVTPKEKIELDKINKKLDNYKQELTYYYNKYKFVPSKSGYFYIMLDAKIVKGKKITCYKFGFALNMNDRIKNYKIGNFMSKLICYIPINVDGFLLETIIKNKLKPHLTKLNTETICFMSLNTLKKEILDSIIFMSSHICNCVLCKKTYKFNEIPTHPCNNKNKFIDFDIIKKVSKRTSKKNSKK